MNRLLIINIKGIVQYNRSGVVKGAEMAELPVFENGWILTEGDHIHSVGHMDEPILAPVNDVIDASGCYVFPAWCDSHTHIVFAGSREQEFAGRISGLTYEEIARQGGGILNSAKRLAETSEDDLFESAMSRLEYMMRQGTGAVEIKSGYGLSFESELKMLNVIARLKKASPLTIKSTFLGAHAIPAEYKNDRAAFIRMLTDDLLPVIAKNKLADYIDVFCDRGFFTVPETEAILEAGAAYGLIPKIHANELDFSGGIQVGVKHKALSVDHLEFTGDEEIAVLKESMTMPTLLPGTAFFLQLHYPPARKMMEAGLPVALASDFNPGSCPSGKMSFILSLACLYLKMTPREAINAATLNSAYAMGVEKELGSIIPGKKANLFITNPIPSLEYIPYAFNGDHVRQVIINGILR